ncbi:MAG: cytochrome c bioproteinis protein [Parcubacteria group bacterium Gr01-1014_24]|nr:MAG: cytochrome c bioproteinis protein [Parcubacteria group bacterium Gr01-1014_24]
MEINSLTIPILVGAAIIDSINPCAFGVLVFLLAYLFKAFNSRRLVLAHGLTYISAVFLTYLLAGLLLLPIISQLGRISTWAYVGIGVILIVFGVLEIKDFFFYGKGFSLGIFPSAGRRIEILVRHITGRLSTSFFLGVFVALVELPCTGAVYLGVLTLVSIVGLTANNIFLLVIYNLLFVLPLVIILFLIHRGGQTEKFEKWREKYRRYMRLAIGLLLVVLGVWMIKFIF